MKLSHLSDAVLIANFQDLVIEEREKLVLQLEHVVELDRRKLFFHYDSLKSYLVEEHGFEEWRAERLIRAARMLKRFPEIKFKLESGKLNLTLLEIAQGCAYREKLSDDELFEILEAISGMSCKAAKREIASRFPASLELPIDRIRPLTADLSEVSFVASQSTLDKLEEIRGLLAHSHPQIKMGELIDIIATDFRERYHPAAKAKRAEEREAKKKEAEKKQTETVETPAVTLFMEPEEKRSPSQSLVNEMTITQGYQCSYVDETTNQRCTSTWGLEIDHKKSWVSGGKTELKNCRYLCFQHHKRVSFLEFGESSNYSKVRKERNP